MDDLKPLAPLVGALFVFLLSTKQFRLRLRAPIWLLGAALLGASGYLALERPDHYGIFRFAADAATHPADSVLLQTLPHAWRNVAGALLPMADLFLALAALLAIVAAIAMTPGEKTEKALRPFLWALVGAIGGGFVALALIASGLGGYYKSRSYSAFGNDVHVIDGDTLSIGDISLRLAGIDAPEFHDLRTNGEHNRREQFCRTSNGATPCGSNARDELLSIIHDKLIYCAEPNWKPHREELAEAFGRPLVQCWAYSKHGERVDLALKMAQQGYADVFRDADNESDAPRPYECAVLAALGRSAGIWQDAVLSPHDWRNEPEKKAAFLADGSNHLTSEDFPACGSSVAPVAGAVE